jgi:capsid protein
MSATILDQFGRPMRLSSRLIDAGSPPVQLPYWRTHFGSTDAEVSVYEWQKTVAASKKLYANLGPAKGAILDKAIYSVGRAWSPDFDGANEAWGEKATELLEQQWYGVADVRGEPFDFVTDLFVCSVSIDRDGDVFILLTETADGYPAIQIIPGHRVGQRDSEGKVLAGAYKGLSLVNGVIRNKQGRAVAYRVLGDETNGSQDKDISARSMIHLFDPEWYDQSRGFPGLTHAINDLRSLMTTQGYEEKAAMLASEIGLIEENPTGLPNISDPAFALTSTDVVSTANRPTTGLVTQTLEGGGYRYFQANTGSKITTLKSDRPGASWESFMDRLIRNAMVGLCWPYEMCWDPSKLGGANVRLILAKAMRSVEDRQDLLRGAAKRIIGYAVSRFIERGDLAPNSEWWKWSFSMPARISVDYGRDAKADREDLAAGIVSLTDLLAEGGKKLRQHIRKVKKERAEWDAAGLGNLGAAPAQQQQQPMMDDEEDAEDQEDDAPGNSDDDATEPAEK